MRQFEHFFYGTTDRAMKGMRTMKKISIRKIAFSAAVAAVYAALTMATASFSYGPIQFRISEALNILPFFFPDTVWGLFVGCLIANLISTYGIFDLVFGSLGSLLAALAVMAIGKTGRKRIGSKVLACFMPALFNGAIVGAVIAWSTVPGAFFAAFWLNAAEVAVGELAVMFVLGLPLMLWFPGTGAFRELVRIRNK